jgi:hypothetical protein
LFRLTYQKKKKKRASKNHWVNILLCGVLFFLFFSAGATYWENGHHQALPLIEGHFAIFWLDFERKTELQKKMQTEQAKSGIREGSGIEVEKMEKGKGIPYFKVIDHLVFE